MAWFKRSSRCTMIALSLVLGLTLSVPTQVQAQLRSSSLSNRIPNQWELGFRPPQRTGPGAPVNTQGGATRGDDCLPQGQGPTALVPASGVGTTVAEYPTIFWYMPQTSASEVQFVLNDANDQEVYSVKYALTKSAQDGLASPGIMSLTLPAHANLSPLKIGEEYRWQVRLICDASDSSAPVWAADGGIKRIAPNLSLNSRLQQANPQERIAVYAEERVWYETVASLVELMRDRPNDPTLAEAWDKLLNSVGLEGIAEKPESQGVSNTNS